MCNMKDCYRQWSPTQIARFVSYSYHVIDALFLRFSIHKVQTIGDRVFAISGVNETDPSSHHSIRAVHMISVLHRLCSKEFAHYPARIPILLKAFGPTAAAQFPGMSGTKDWVGCVRMPLWRVGLHVAEVSAVVTPISGAPHFDVYGSAVGIALGIMNRAAPGSILLSAKARDTIVNNDSGKRVRVKSAGNIMFRSSNRRVPVYVVSTARFAMPHKTLADLGIRYAVLPSDFVAEDRLTETSTTGVQRSGGVVSSQTSAVE
jgi:class 3 adenylate cyclase